MRSTWVTLALTAGVPVDLVRKVTGHTTTARTWRQDQAKLMAMVG